jgi:hypothetical protein
MDWAEFRAARRQLADCAIQIEIFDLPDSSFFLGE